MLVNTGIRLRADSIAVGSLEFNLAAVGEYNLRCLSVPRNGLTTDVGAGSFTIEFAVKPTAANVQGAVTRGANVDWQNANIILDGDESGQGNGFGIALGNGIVAFGLNSGATSFTIVGGADLRGTAWHWISAQFRASDGQMWLHVDGTLVDSQDTAAGSVALSGLTPLSICGSGGATNCAPTDNALVFGIEKGGFDNATYPGYAGRLAEVRISDSLRYSGSNYSVPTSPFTADGNTVGLFHLGEQTGTAANDVSGDGNNGTLNVAGGRPAWHVDSPFT